MRWACRSASVVAAWARQRGTTLARHLEEVRFGPLLQHLDVQVESAHETASRLRESSLRLGEVLRRPGSAQPGDTP